METTLLELREEKSTIDPNNNINGKFGITLKELTLNDGDELMVRNVFIDSKKESNTITIENDTTLTMSFICGLCLNTDIQIGGGYTGGDPWTTNGGNFMNLNAYEINNNKDLVGGVFFSQNTTLGDIRKFTNDGLINRTSQNGNPTYIGDTFTYYPCRRLEPPQGTYRFLQTITIQLNNFKVRGEGGNFIQTFQYTDIKGNLKTFKIFIPVVNNSNYWSRTISLDDISTILFDSADGIKPISPSENQLKTPQFNVKYTGFGSVDTDNFRVLHPIEHTATVLIPAGEYQPDILAQRINIGLNSYNKFNIFDFSSISTNRISNDNRGNPIFSKGGQSFLYKPISDSQGDNSDFIFDDNLPVSYGTTHSGSNYFHMVSEDDSNVILKVLKDLGDNQGGLANVANQFYGGTTSFQIIFDQNTQTFKMMNLHNSYYVSVGNPAVSQIGIKLNKSTLFQNGDVMSLDTKRGDIRITGLSSSGDGIDSNFWFDKLGFDNSVITQVGTTIKTYDGLDQNAGNQQVYVPTFDSKGATGFSINKTDAFVSGELQIQNNKFSVDYLNNITYPILIPNTDTIDIFGLKTLNDLIVDDGYYKIIIKGTTATSNKLHDTDKVSLISAIVGKYYSGESYTNGYSSDGINYIHRGESITLSDFQVEILNSREENPIIGTDNTIILQVNKNIITQNNESK